MNDISVPVRAFNYDALDPVLAADARAVAARIKVRVRESYAETGRELIDMKERLGHGRFGVWLQAEFDMTARSAERYMAVGRLLQANSDIVSHLPPATVQALAAPSLSEEVRSTCLSRLRDGIALSARDVSDCARAAKDTERRKRFTPTPRNKAKRQEELSKLEAQRVAEETAYRRATIDRRHLVELICETLGDKRSDAIRLLRRLKGWSISKDLLEGLACRVGGACCSEDEQDFRVHGEAGNT